MSMRISDSVLSSLRSSLQGSNDDLNAIVSRDTVLGLIEDLEQARYALSVCEGKRLLKGLSSEQGERIALSLLAGARAIEKNSRLSGSSYVYDVLGDHRSVSYYNASQLLREVGERAMEAISSEDTNSERIEELIQAANDGRVVVYPFKVGTELHYRGVDTDNTICTARFLGASLSNPGRFEVEIDYDYYEEHAGNKLVCLFRVEDIGRTVLVDI